MKKNDGGYGEGQEYKVLCFFSLSDRVFFHTKSV